MRVGKKWAIVLRNLVLTYICTALLLLVLAFLVYKMQLTESVVNIAVILIYVAVTFFGGLLTGKAVKENKFLWGAALGVLYITLIFAASWLLQKDAAFLSVKGMTAALLCICGGLTGGMFG